MSLWNKPIDSITYQDVEEFCKFGWEESIRLDYKVDWPNDLAKTMAAMANTMGGTIIVGVDADKTTNKPIWPPVPPAAPQTMLKTQDGLTERVIQIARDAIFPPLSIDATVLDNQASPRHSIVVVRIPESKDAPHATDGKKRVYIYERTKNQNYAHEAADIDYIERLIKRREKSEELREQLLSRSIARGRFFLSDTKLPLRWAAVIPVYPWRKIATPQLCVNSQACISPTTIDSHRTMIQNIPGGLLVRHIQNLSDGKQRPLGSVTITDEGMIFGISFGSEVAQEGQDLMGFFETEALIKGIIKTSIKFYDQSGVERPGYLTVAIGITNALGLKVIKPNTRRDRLFPFPDTTFRTDYTTLTLSEEIATQLMSEIQFTFNVP